MGQYNIIEKRNNLTLLILVILLANDSWYDVLQQYYTYERQIQAIILFIIRMTNERHCCLTPFVLQISEPLHNVEYNIRLCTSLLNYGTCMDNVIMGIFTQYQTVLYRKIICCKR